MGLDIDRIFSELPNVPFRDHVWPKFLYENAARLAQGLEVAMGPLAGIKVIELPNIGPVQFAGMLLSDLGAEVLRVDRASDVATGRTVAGGNASRVLGDRPRPAQRRRRPEEPRRRRGRAAAVRAAPTCCSRASAPASPNGSASGPSRAGPAIRRLVYAPHDRLGPDRSARGRRRPRRQLPLGRGRARGTSARRVTRRSPRSTCSPTSAAAARSSSRASSPRWSSAAARASVRSSTRRWSTAARSS